MKAQTVQVTDNRYKDTELGPLPEEWTVDRLEHVANLRAETVHPKQTNIELYVGLEHILPGSIKLQQYGKPSDVISAKSVFYPGDILYAKLRPYLNKVVLSTQEGISSTDIIILNPKNVNHTFLAYYLTSKPFLHYAISTMTGVNHPRTSWNKLKVAKIPMPPLQEQENIAFTLSTLRSAIEKTENFILCLKELKKSLLKHLFTYGPVTQEEAEKVDLKDTEYGSVPKDWPVEKLGDIFKLTSGKTRPAVLNPSASNEFPFPVYGGNGIMGFSDQFFLSWPTIVLGRVGAYCGAVHVTSGKCWVSDNALFAKEFMKKCDLKYMALVLEILDLNRLRNRGSQPLISQSIVYSQSVPFPPLPVQKQIASVLSAVNDRIEKAENKRIALQELFKSLLDNLMTAKIRVNHLKLQNG